MSKAEMVFPLYLKLEPVDCVVISVTRFGINFPFGQILNLCSNFECLFSCWQFLSKINKFRQLLMSKNRSFASWSNYRLQRGATIVFERRILTRFWRVLTTVWSFEKCTFDVKIGLFDGDWLEATICWRVSIGFDELRQLLTAIVLNLSTASGTVWRQRQFKFSMTIVCSVERQSFLLFWWQWPLVAWCFGNDQECSLGECWRANGTVCWRSTWSMERRSFFEVLKMCFWRQSTCSMERRLFVASWRHRHFWCENWTFKVTASGTVWRQRQLKLSWREFQTSDTILMMSIDYTRTSAYYSCYTLNFTCLIY